jgi:hypothetical protein
LFFLPGSLMELFFPSPPGTNCSSERSAISEGKRVRADRRAGGFGFLFTLRTQPLPLPTI